MKRYGLIAMAAVAIVLGGCDRTPEPGTDSIAGKCRDVTIEIDVGDYAVSYPKKAKEPIPMFRRNCPFAVQTNWLGSAGPLTLSDFRAVADAGGGKWVEEERRMIKPCGEAVSREDEAVSRDDEAVSRDGEAVSFRPPRTNWGPYCLETSMGGPPRLILFTVELTTPEGIEVTFDPPWSEKP